MKPYEGGNPPKSWLSYLGHSLTRYRRIGYNLNVMRQSACLVFDPIMVAGLI